MDKLCFIYINYRSICAAIKEIDKEAKLLEELIADLLLNQEDDLVEIEPIKDNNEEDSWEDISTFFNEILVLEDINISGREE
jgi:hypothetical protein